MSDRPRSGFVSTGITRHAKPIWSKTAHYHVNSLRTRKLISIMR